MSARSADRHLLALASPAVAGLRPYEPGGHAEEIARRYGLERMLLLASNENALGAGPAARKALQRLPELNRYPDANGSALKRDLADRHGVEAGQITLGNGSNDVLELIARALLTPQYEVVYSQYAFIVYALVTRALGARAVEVPAHDYAHDPQALAASVSARTRLLYIANPNNPTGTFLSAAQLRRLLQNLPEHVVAVIDEAYCEYATVPDYPRCIPWIKEFPRLVVTRTFSKIYGLAGLRVGYAVSRPELADLMNRVRQPFNVNVLGQQAARAALQDQGHLEHSVRLNSAGQEQWREACARLGLRRIDALGNFICLDLARPAQPIFEQLLRQGILVRPLHGFGMPRHLRISIGLEQENQRCIQALQQALETA